MLENIYENKIIIKTYENHSNMLHLYNSINGSNNNNYYYNNRINFIYSVQVLDYSITQTFLMKASVHKNCTFRQFEEKFR